MNVKKQDARRSIHRSRLREERLGERRIVNRASEKGKAAAARMHSGKRSASYTEKHNKGGLEKGYKKDRK